MCGAAGPSRKFRIRSLLPRREQIQQPEGHRRPLEGETAKFVVDAVESLTQWISKGILQGQVVALEERAADPLEPLLDSRVARGEPSPGE